jgi:hypothetical protein
MANNNINLNGKKPIRKFEIKFNLNPKNIIIFIFVGIFGLSFLLSMMTTPSSTGEEISLSQALTDIKEGKTKEVFVNGDKIVLTYNEKDKTALARFSLGGKSILLKSILSIKISQCPEPGAIFWPLFCL